MKLRRPPLEFEELLFPIKVRCGIVDCLMTRGPVQLQPTAAWQERYTKIPVCHRDKVRLEALSDGETYLSPPRIWPKRTSEVDDGPRPEGLKHVCPLAGTEYCPPDCLERGVCPAMFSLVDKAEGTD